MLPVGIEPTLMPFLRRPPLPIGLRERNGPGGRICTRTGSVLSGVPLLLGYAGEKMVLPVGIAPTTRRFEAGRSDLLSYGSLLKWCAGTVLPRLPPQCRCGDLLLIYRRVNAARCARR